MDIPAILRGGLRVANNVFSSLQSGQGGTEPVLHQAWIRDGAYAKPVYATAVERHAIVTEGGKPWRTAEGDEITPVATLLFLEPILDEYGAEGRTGPLDPRDLWTLADGRSGRVREVPAGILDPSTGRGFFAIVALV